MEAVSTKCKRSAYTAAPANGRTANESQPSGYTASSPSCPRPESPRSRMGNLVRASLKFECGQFLRYRDVLEDHVGGKAVLERRKILATDQRRQVVAAFLRNLEAVFGDEIVRHELLLVRHVPQLRHAYGPFVG